jgi:hypothetical protein
MLMKRRLVLAGLLGLPALTLNCGKNQSCADSKPAEPATNRAQPSSTFLSAIPSTSSSANSQPATSRQAIEKNSATVKNPAKSFKLNQINVYSSLANSQKLSHNPCFCLQSKRSRLRVLRDA